MPAERLDAHLQTRLGSFSLELQLQAQAGVTVLFGPSGSGKTTSLRCLAGLQPMTGGYVRLDGRDLTTAPPEARRVGYVFQHAALFPHLSVVENVRFGGASQAEALRWLETLRVGSLGGRRPDTLSGGERQRVALARALASRPEWLLLDEPFSALDAALRDELLAELKALVLRERLITVLVTHARADVEALDAREVRLPQR